MRYRINRMTRPNSRTIRYLTHRESRQTTSCIQFLTDQHIINGPRTVESQGSVKRRGPVSQWGAHPNRRSGPTLGLRGYQKIEESGATQVAERLGQTNERQARDEADTS